MINKLKAAIFDVDGVLLNSMPIWDVAASRYLRRCGAAPEPGLDQKIAAFSLEDGAAYLKKTYALPQQTDSIKAGVLSVISDFYEHEVALKPGVFDAVHWLKAHGAALTLATTSDAALVDKTLSRLGIMACFDGIFCCTQLATSKSEPKIYLTAARHLKAAPAETAVFEDALHAVQTAKRAGFFVFGVADAASASDRQAIEKASDVYLNAFTETEKWQPRFNMQS